MKAFNIYHLCTGSFTSMREKLVPVIGKCVKPDRIWLLGATLWRRRTESIFNVNAPTSQHTSDYFLLILIPDFQGKQQHEWQDQIEQRCSTVMPVTTIVMETSTFRQWFEEGHEFPNRVHHNAVNFYDSGALRLEPRLEILDCSGENDKGKIFAKGLDKGKEFLAGAELYQVRKQNTMAAFMLHQSAEQALRTILKIGIGFHINTHNLDRLLRYASLASAKIPDIFPRNTDQEKRLFSLLQKAYSDSRYKVDYQVSADDLYKIEEKVRHLHKVTEEVGLLYSKPGLHRK